MLIIKHYYLTHHLIISPCILNSPSEALRQSCWRRFSAERCWSPPKPVNRWRSNALPLKKNLFVYTLALHFDRYWIESYRHLKNSDASVVHFGFFPTGSKSLTNLSPRGFSCLLFTLSQCPFSFFRSLSYELLLLFLEIWKHCNHIFVLFSYISFFLIIHTCWSHIEMFSIQLLDHFFYSLGKCFRGYSLFQKRQ